MAAESLGDEETFTTSFPGFTDAEDATDTFTYTILDSFTNLEPTWLAITGTQIDLTPDTGTMKTTYTLNVKIADNNSCLDSVGGLSATFQWDVTITDTNNPPVLTPNAANFEFFQG